MKLPYMKAIFFAAVGALLLPAAGAQEVTIGTLLELEDRIKLKKLNEELNKTNGVVPAPQITPILPLPAPKKISYPTQTLEVHGTDQDYTGILSMNGMNYSVKKGAVVNGYQVTSISPAGIELTKRSQPGRAGKKNKAGIAKDTVVFAPMPLR